MSFQEQERALFDLLFDQTLREQFCSNSLKALEGYDLSEEEQADFREIRPDALEMDAKMRRGFLLSHICRAFPLSFSLVCSFDGGRNILKNLVDADTIRANVFERPVLFGTRLRETMAEFRYEQEGDHHLSMAIIETELSMAMVSSSLKKQQVLTNVDGRVSTDIGPGWSACALKFAPHVGVTIIPRPYSEMKKILCPVADTELWDYLAHGAVSKSERRSIMNNEDRRLFFTRARIARMSLCDPEVDFQTMELSEGFASLVQHLDGQNSVDTILQQLQQAGAEQRILEGVKDGFLRLLENGMLEINKEA